MQKKLIALAIAGLSSTAFAQSNVEIYGLFDICVANYSGISQGTDGTNVARTNGTAGSGSGTQVASGCSSSSRLGFRGKEALGNGMNATFVIETNLTTDGNASAQGGGNTGLDVAGARQMILAVDGAFGKVSAGKMYTPFFSTVAAVDPFGATGIANAGIIHPLTANVARAASSLMYSSPNFSGFSFSYLYGMSENYDRIATTVGGHTASWNLLYANGPLVLGVAQIHLADVGMNNALTGAGGAAVVPVALTTGAQLGVGVSSTVIGGTYNFGVVKLHLANNRAKSSGMAVNIDHNDWHLGLSKSWGAHTVKGVYNRADDKTTTNMDANQWGLGYEYGLSKRTTLYTTYSKVSNKNGAHYSVNWSGTSGTFATHGVASGSAAGNGGATNRETGFVFGAKHSF
jgi:GBP family porin